MHIVMINICLACIFRMSIDRMNKKLSINEKTAFIEKRITNYYEKKGISKRIWMIILQDNIERTRGTIEKNIIKIKTADNLRSICMATGLSSDYLLGLSEEDMILKIKTYKDAFYFAKHMIDKRLIVKYKYRGKECYILSEELEQIVINYSDLSRVISHTINMFLCEEAIELERLENEWFNVCRNLFIRFYEIDTDKSMKEILGDHLNEQMKLHNYNNNELMEVFNKYVNKNFTRDDNNKYYAKKK